MGTTQSEDKAVPEGEPGTGVGAGFKLGLGLGPAGKRVRLSAAGDLLRWQSKSKEMNDLYTVKSEYNFGRHRHHALDTGGEGEGEGEEGDYIVDQSAALVSDNHASSLQSVGCAFEDEEEEEESASPTLPPPLPMFLPLLYTVNQSAAVEVKQSPSPRPTSAAVPFPVPASASITASASVPASVSASVPASALASAANTGSPTAPGIAHLVLPPLPSPLLVSDTNSSTSNSSSDVINVTPRDIKKSFEDPRTTPQLTRKLDGIGE